MNKIGSTLSGNPTKPKNSRWKKVLQVFGIIAAVMAIFMIVGSILHATYYKGKFEQISPYGQLVMVGDLAGPGDDPPADGEDTVGSAMYKSDVYKVSFKYAADWKLNPNYFERYEGKNGFFQVSAINGESLSIDEVAQDQAFHKLKPYGSAPQIVKRTISGREAWLILPSNDQPKEMQNQAGLIVTYPTAISIDDSSYNYFVLWADKVHIEQIGSTLSFL